MTERLTRAWWAVIGAALVLSAAPRVEAQDSSLVHCAPEPVQQSGNGGGR
jgi:hypothetical protein